ncbi:phage tail protein [Jeotgalicoccus halotolerans]|uniref:phage tail protein n=1 Tax=Jeotgalicoccus halotolerans TaxID=157227 RepID=UPI003511B512
MLKVIDLKGNTFPAQAQVNKKQIVNGEQQLSLSFFVSEMNIDFLPDLSFNWLANFEQEDYTIINPSIEAITKGKSITAILKFFTDFGGMYLQDEVEDKSMTALNAYTELFANTGKRVHLVDNFYSNTLSYQKNQSRLERFHYYNRRFKAEFVVRGDDVYLYNKVGSSKPDVRIDEDLNVKSATVEIDSENFFTWCKCYYDLEQNDGGSSEENYRKEYVWRDSTLIAQYGEIEGPALYQGNIKNETTMKEFARDKQQESVKISHSVDLVDLQKQGYAEFIFNIGDTVRLSLSSIDITVDIRIVEKDETWVENQYGEWERTNLTLTLGSVSAVQSYKNSRSDSMQELQDWIDGRKPIPQRLLEPAIQRAADIVLGDTDSVMEYRKDRMTGHHSKNEGNNVTLNVSGLVFYRNGVPTTGATYEGIIADAITAGTIKTNNVTIMGVSDAGDVIIMDGSIFKVWNVNAPSKYVEISKGEVHIYKGGFRLTGKDGREVFVDGLMRGSRAANIIDFYTGSVVSFRGRNLMWDSYDNQRVKYIDDQYKGRFLDLVIATGLSERSQSTSAHAIVTVRDFPGTVVASERFLIRRQNDDAEMDFRRIRCDLQALFNAVPDYRAVSLYVEVQLDSAYSGNEILFRINKGEFHA